jgi:hypothetical protein
MAIMDVLKSILGFVWRAQLLPSWGVLVGLCVAWFLYDITGRHTGVVALVLLLVLGGGLACVSWIGPRPHKGDD